MPRTRQSRSRSLFDNSARNEARKRRCQTGKSADYVDAFGDAASAEPGISVSEPTCPHPVKADVMVPKRRSVLIRGGLPARRDSPNGRYGISCPIHGSIRLDAANLITLPHFS